jgi:hypothetical protein
MARIPKPKPITNPRVAELVPQAEALGRAAFEADKKRIPAQDPAVLPLLAGLQVGEGLPILNAWLRGWDRANLAAPVPAQARPSLSKGDPSMSLEYDILKALGRLS